MNANRMNATANNSVAAMGSGKAAPNPAAGTTCESNIGTGASTGLNQMQTSSQPHNASAVTQNTGEEQLE